jgi:hypothetical protein
MLCDDIAREGFYNLVFDEGGLADITKRIAAANKFVLSRDFAQAADELSHDLTQVHRALPFCRLPYRETWIEVAQQDRLHFIAGNPPAFDQVTPIRVGFLLTATSDKLDAWTAHLFWRHPVVPDKDITRETNNAACIALAFDMANGFAHSRVGLRGDDREDRITSEAWQKLSEDQQRALANAVQPAYPDYGYRPETIYGGDELADYIASMGRRDWAGEPAYLEATLALLNARNASVTEYVDRADYNRKRAKKGQHSLASHHLLKIHPRQLVKIRGKDAHGRDAELRAHFVRGHWKVRATGVFFWRPFVRGDRKLGEVHKTYEVD